MPRKKKEPTFSRRPNNTGTVTKLSGNRRKPWIAKVPGERDLMGKRKQKIIGYFEDQQEANEALTLYLLAQKKSISEKEIETLSPDTYAELIRQRNKNTPTFEELYLKFYNDKVVNLSASTQRRYKSNFKRLELIHNKPLPTITLKQLQEIFDANKQTVSKDTLTNMKILVQKTFERGIMEGIITQNDNLTKYINVDTDFKKIKIKHKPFDINEIKELIKDASPSAKLLLIYIFTGARPSELLNLSKNRFHIDEQCDDDGKIKTVSYIVTGSKTEAGKDRIIPIHDLIKPYIKEMLKGDVFMPISAKDTYEVYKRDYFDKTMDRLNMKHLPHDTRHTFGTLATMNNLDIYMTKKILGHKFQDLTKDVYTHTLINRLYDEIQKIKV